MSAPRQIVESFIESWSGGADEFFAAVQSRFTDATAWENVGYSTTTGADDAIEHLKESMNRLGWVRVAVDTLSIAVDGNHVLTERVDNHLAQDGAVLFSVRCASCFDVSGDQILAIREYFDTAPMVAARATGSAMPTDRG